MSKSGTKLTIQLYFNGKFSNFHHFISLKIFTFIEENMKKVSLNYSLLGKVEIYSRVLRKIL